MDKESIGQFDADLSRNLYKIWNRMTSGSYFPPAVRTVLIPKKQGGSRPLGIPTVGQRIAQTVVKQYLEPSLDNVFHNSSFGYRRGRSAHQAPKRLSPAVISFTCFPNTKSIGVVSSLLNFTLAGGSKP